MPKRPQKKRIQKTEERRILDLKDHLENLEHAQKRLAGGNRAAYKDVLTNLRTLLGKGPAGQQAGLLLSIMAKHQIRVTSETESGAVISFDEFLVGTQVLDSRKLTHLEFVWELASQDAAHSDEGLAPEYAMAESIMIGGIPTNLRILEMITNWTLGAGRIALAKFRRPDGSRF